MYTWNENYLNDLGFSDIYIFNECEHQLKINSLTVRYKIFLRNKVSNIKDNEIRNYLTAKKTEIHIFLKIIL